MGKGAISLLFLISFIILLVTLSGGFFNKKTSLKNLDSSSKEFIKQCTAGTEGNLNSYSVEEINNRFFLINKDLGYQFDITALPKSILDRSICNENDIEILTFRIKPKGGYNSVARFEWHNPEDSLQLSLEEYSKYALYFGKGKHQENTINNGDSFTQSELDYHTLANNKAISWTNIYSEEDQSTEKILRDKHYLIDLGNQKYLHLVASAWEINDYIKVEKDFNQIVSSFKLTK